MAPVSRRVTLVTFGVGIALAAPALAGLPATGAQGAKYAGPAGCSTAACHGAVTAKLDGRTLHDEYTRWSAKDRHAKSWEFLATIQAKEIGLRMGLKAPPQASARCLQCHSLLVPEEQRQKTWDLKAGNSCDNCHGPSEKWLEPHAKENAKFKDWTRAQSLSAGMTDTLDLAVRAAVCVRCHLAIDHEMLAAGHPYLGFELDNFQFRLPPHWSPEPPSTSSQAWAAGQAVSLRDALKQLDMRMKAKAPDQYVMDAVVVAHAYLITVRRVATRLAPEAWAPLEKELAWLTEKGKASAAGVAATATPEFQSALYALARTLGSHACDAATNLALVQDVSRAAADVEAGGFRAAEQVFYAVDALYRAHEAEAKPAGAPAIHGLIAKLQTAVVPPAKGEWAIEPFVSALKELEAALAKP